VLEFLNNLWGARNRVGIGLSYRPASLYLILVGRECLLVSWVRIEVSIVFNSSNFSSMFCNLDRAVFNPSGKTIGVVCSCVCVTVELVFYVYTMV
jgi:hypothetical protein